MIFKIYNNDIAHIETSKKALSAVVLLPITRVTSKAMANWEKILKVAEDSETPAIIVLDKTPNGEATSFFEKFCELKLTDIYIIRRPSYEPIYDSQRFVTISKEMWIIQLHDDDEWSGLLQIPQDANELEMFSTEFMFKDKRQSLKWETSPPARINFTILPSQIWNRFSEFISSQGGHVAGSVDSTLDRVSRTICTRRHVSNFTYVYDNRHWKQRRNASKNLKILAKQDGWSFLSCVDIQLLNRAIDGITAIEFFRDLIPQSKVDECRIEEFRKLSLTRRRRFFLGVVYTFTLLLKFTNYAIFKIIKLAFISRNMVFLNDASFKYRFLLNVTNSRNKLELRNHITELRETMLISQLTDRFIFWEKMLLIDDISTEYTSR
jgi:hypothetical protein